METSCQRLGDSFDDLRLLVNRKRPNAVNTRSLELREMCTPVGLNRLFDICKRQFYSARRINDENEL